MHEIALNRVGKKVTLRVKGSTVATEKEAAVRVITKGQPHMDHIKGVRRVQAKESPGMEDALYVEGPTFKRIAPEVMEREPEDSDP